MRVIVLSSVLLASCCPTILVLDPEWRPLREVRQDPSVPPDVIHTRLDAAYTADVCAFSRIDADERHAVLLHEQHHAVRQAEDGLDRFLRDYANSSTFRWAEESAGWRLQVQDYVRRGVKFDPVVIARFLSEQYDSMIGFGPALAWVIEAATAASGGSR